MFDGTGTSLEDCDDVLRRWLIDDAPKRQERGHHRKERDDDEIAPNEWKHRAPPGSNPAESIHSGRISQRNWNSRRRFQEKDNAESGDEPVPEPQRGGAGAIRTLGFNDPKCRRDPEQLGDDDERDRHERSAPPPDQ